MVKFALICVMILNLFGCGNGNSSSREDAPDASPVGALNEKRLADTEWCDYFNTGGQVVVLATKVFKSDGTFFHYEFGPVSSPKYNYSARWSLNGNSLKIIREGYSDSISQISIYASKAINPTYFEGERLTLERVQEGSTQSSLLYSCR